MRVTSTRNSKVKQTRGWRRQKRYRFICFAARKSSFRFRAFCSRSCSIHIRKWPGLQLCTTWALNGTILIFFFLSPSGSHWFQSRCKVSKTSWNIEKWLQHKSLHFQNTFSPPSSSRFVKLSINNAERKYLHLSKLYTARNHNWQFIRRLW